NGAARKRSSSRHAGRKAIKIVVDLEGFVVARYHDDALMRLTQYRRLLSQVIKIGVRIVHEPVAAKEIVLLKLEVLIVHIGSPFELLPATEAFTTKPGLSGIVPGARNGRRRHAHFSQSAESQAGMAGSVIKQMAHFKHSVIPGPLEFHCLKPACRDSRQWVERSMSKDYLQRAALLHF